MKRLIASLAVLATCGVVAMTVGVAFAAPPPGQLCPAGDSGKIDTTGDPATVTITAPAGMVIYQYCVKAGSAKQGFGAVIVTVDPPVNSLTISYPGGKAVSHYSFWWRPGPPGHEPPPPGHEPPPPPPPHHH
ncbi:MAG: hypothetical protein H0U82_12760 [Actinobacteria bacterium]|nr:hypothetical protein [Actinomycetota bacterium]